MSKEPLGAILGRVARLCCPRCGEDKLFKGFFRMHETCSSCAFKYERSPGYFLGSAYINYGLTALIVTFSYTLLHFGVGFTNAQLLVPLVTFVIVFPILCFRHARAFWLGFDCFFDSTGFDRPDAGS